MNKTWVRSWRAVIRHEIFTDPAPNKVAFLGTSMFGERYCQREPHDQVPISDDSCCISSMMNHMKADYPSANKLNFHFLAKGGTKATLHLYFLLNLLDTYDLKIKYIIYDIPRKFGLDSQTRLYSGLYKELDEEIRDLPPELKTRNIAKFKSELTENIAKYDSGFNKLFSELTEDEMLRIFQEKRTWLRELLSLIRRTAENENLWSTFQGHLKQHNEYYASHTTNELGTPVNELSEQDVFWNPDDFEFMDILVELCRIKHIQLILYFGPINSDKRQQKIYEEGIYQPNYKRYSRAGVKFLDYRDLPFYYPRDTPDGSHPSISLKYQIAQRLLTDLNRMEAER